jgi:DNA-binding MarR family transcriptional regulator
MRRKLKSDPPSSRLEPADIAERLHAGAIRLLRLVRAADAEAGISAPKLSALSVLVFGGPMTLKALAAAEQVRAPTMSQLVADLESEGLALKRADPADRRSVRIEPTAKGRALMEEGKRRRLALLQARLRGLGVADRATLDRAADLILRVAGGVEKREG